MVKNKITVDHSFAFVRRQHKTDGLDKISNYMFWPEVLHLISPTTRESKPPAITMWKEANLTNS